MAETSIVQQILDVLNAISEWFVSAVNSIVSLFYVPGTGITLLGTLAVLGFGIATIYGLVSLIRGFMHGRG